MTRNLRAALAILTIGFAVEAAGSLYEWVTHAVDLPFHGILLYLSPVFTGAGLLFLLVGRSEWNELHHHRVHHATRFFVLAIVAGAAAVAAVAYYVLEAPAADQPALLAPFVGVAVAIAFVSTYITYSLIVAHLLRPASWALLAGAFLWALYVAYLLGSLIASDLPGDITALRDHSASYSTLATPLTAALSTMFVTYLLLLVAYADAHRRVAKGLDAAAPT